MQIGLGIGIPFTKSQVWLAVQTVFTPAKLFDSGANGLWLDPSDLTTMFQDSAGTTPVTAVEQPVGLILDKSKGLVLGSEILLNGTFDSTNNWTLSGIGATISGGSLTFSSSTGWARQAISTSYANIVYVELTLVISSITGGAVYLVWDGGPQSQNYTAAGTYTVRLTRTGGVGGNFYIFTSGTTTATVDLVSMKPIQGNHAFQSTSANRPTLSARYNLLTKTEQFDDAVWTKTAATLGSLVTAPDGSLTARTVNFAGLTSEIKQTPSGTFSSTAFFAYVAVKGTAGETLNYGISSSADQVLTFNGQWQYINYTRTTSTPTLWFGTWSGATTRSFAVWHPDLRVANDALNQPAYQRVNTATDYDSDATKFPWYLKFNGTSSSLQTASINFTATDKMFVSAGVRKLSDAATNIIAELSSGTTFSAGSFALASRVVLADDIWFYSRGTVGSGVVPSGYASPTTKVLSGIGNISGDQAVLRVNGTQAASSTADQGTGNYGNYPLYIGARAGTSLFFNGYLYQLVIAGKQASTEEIDSTENYIELKTFGKDMSYVYDYLVDSTGNQITDSAGNPIYVTATYQ